MHKRNSFVFPYQARLEEDGSVKVFPVARLLAKRRGEVRASLLLIIDSGAVISALPMTDDELFGIRARDGVPMRVSGIGGTIQGWIHTVKVHLEGMPLSLPVVFLEDGNASRVLGREGIFDRFTVVFEEDKRRSALVDMQSKESRAIGKTIDAIAGKS